MRCFRQSTLAVVGAANFPETAGVCGSGMIE